MGLARSNHVVAGLILLQHPPHRLHILPGVSPIPHRIQVTQSKSLRLSSDDSRNSRRDLARYKFVSTTRRLMIKGDSAARMNTGAFPVIPGQLETRHLTDPVNRSRVKPRPLVLRRLLRVAEHLA